MPANVVAAKEVRPYGSWRSPLKVSSVTEAQVGLSGVVAAGDAVFWLESRPSEGAFSRGLHARGEEIGKNEQALVFPE